MGTIDLKIEEDNKQIKKDNKMIQTSPQEPVGSINNLKELKPETISNVEETKPQSNEPRTPPLNPTLQNAEFESPTETFTQLPPLTPSLNSTSKFRLSNAPLTPFSNNNNTTKIAVSPLKSPSSFDTDLEESQKPPIRQISSALKTRLSYAFIKYQKGWTNQSLDELEKNLDADVDLDEPFPVNKQSTSGNLFLQSSPFNKNGKSPHKVTKPLPTRSPTRSVNINRRGSIDSESLNTDDGSANLAFLQAISKSRSPKRKSGDLNRNSLKLDISHKTPEAEAIASLMSLSSPHSLKPKESFHDLPRQRLSFGEGKRPKKLDVETESDTEYEGGTDDDGSGETVLAGKSDEGTAEESS
ncbi:hypothetical protein WICMUC_003435 [Wickerhamomyces mucosus]|uniref:Uncharacterized protein n=1 Tax=Wickerhamomyces mucosus TaxID=1378264 RepID=A0A9P8TC95_9ASCO|nr:hypothetical protein WICMUC_003435 [Wickerhamomyces mucosus]